MCKKEVNTQYEALRLFKQGRYKECTKLLKEAECKNRYSIVEHFRGSAAAYVMLLKGYSQDEKDELLQELNELILEIGLYKNK